MDDKIKSVDQKEAKLQDQKQGQYMEELGSTSEWFWLFPPPSLWQLRVFHYEYVKARI